VESTDARIEILDLAPDLALAALGHDVHAATDAVLPGLRALPGAELPLDDERGTAVAAVDHDRVGPMQRGRVDASVAADVPPAGVGKVLLALDEPRLLDERGHLERLVQQR
jgi:hypothetical protein